MKNKYYYLVFIAFLIFLFFEIKKEFFTSNYIIWSNNDKIKWKDFTPTKRIKKEMVATIYSGIWYNIDISSKTAKVFAYMNKRKSKVLDTIKISKRLLRHEQYHFNISEYNTRIFRKELISLGVNKISKNSIRVLLKKHEIQLAKMQNEYDSISRHGKDLIEQPLWELKIEVLLSKTEGYINNDLYSYPLFSKQ